MQYDVELSASLLWSAAETMHTMGNNSSLDTGKTTDSQARPDTRAHSSLGVWFETVGGSSRWCCKTPLSNDSVHTYTPKVA